MGRRKGSKNRERLEQPMARTEPVRPVGYTVPDGQTVYAREEKKESYIERYNRPLPFTMRPAYFAAGYKKEA